MNCVVELRYAPLPWIGAFAWHYWFVVCDESGRHRWEVWQTKNAGGFCIGHVHLKVADLDRAVDFGAQPRNDPLEPRRIARLPLQLFEIVADRLFARQGGNRSEDRGEKAHRPGVAVLDRGDTVWPGIDIDEAPVHLALRADVSARARAVGPWSAVVVSLDAGVPVVGRAHGAHGFVINLALLKIF